MTDVVRCRYCPQLLLTPESRARGYGPVCGQKRGLIPTPRRRTPSTPAATPDIHPDQMAIPIQPTLPKEQPMPAFQPVTDDDQMPDEPAPDECPCPKPDDQYLMEIDAGSVFLTHAACGKPPRDSSEMVESLQLGPVAVRIQPENNCSGWHETSCDCDFWAQMTIPGLPAQPNTPKEN
ncbi:DUF6011 domain-containing protein [Streptomyces antibioticus]|uniref:DUF6011 domain-containing protein n=1 Tax=Streptomyces antibioticus TaxID=1890 RepID=UPI003721D157